MELDDGWVGKGGGVCGGVCGVVCLACVVGCVCVIRAISGIKEMPSDTTRMYNIVRNREDAKWQYLPEAHTCDGLGNIVRDSTLIRVESGWLRRS